MKDCNKSSEPPGNETCPSLDENWWNCSNSKGGRSNENGAICKLSCGEGELAVDAEIACTNGEWLMEGLKVTASLVWQYEDKCQNITGEPPGDGDCTLLGDNWWDCTNSKGGRSNDKGATCKLNCGEGEIALDVEITCTNEGWLMEGDKVTASDIQEYEDKCLNKTGVPPGNGDVCTNFNNVNILATCTLNGQTMNDDLPKNTICSTACENEPEIEIMSSITCLGDDVWLWVNLQLFCVP